MLEPVPPTAVDADHGAADHGDAGHGVFANAYFKKGARHRVCEDYAVAGTLPGLVYAALSDGCSSSPMSDVGARILTHAAVRELAGAGTVDLDRVLRRARLSQRALGLPDESLDATLLMAWRRDHGPVRILAVGDGVIKLRRHGGQIERWHIAEQGAPVYLSYLDSPDRQRALFDAGYGARTVERSTVEPTAGSSTAGRGSTTRGLWRPMTARLDAHSIAYSLELPAGSLEHVLLFSDGVESFEWTGHPRPVPIDHDDVTRELSAFKSTTGAFIERRARRSLNRRCKELEWSHYDDVSIAGFTVNPPQTGARR